METKYLLAFIAGIIFNWLIRLFTQKLKPHNITPSSEIKKLQAGSSGILERRLFQVMRDFMLMNNYDTINFFGYDEVFMNKEETYQTISIKSQQKNVRINMFINDPSLIPTRYHGLLNIIYHEKYSNHGKGRVETCENLNKNSEKASNMHITFWDTNQESPIEKGVIYRLWVANIEHMAHSNQKELIEMY